MKTRKITSLYKLVVSIVIFFVLLSGCVPNETMTLLDAEVSGVKLSISKGLGGMNEDILTSFTDQHAINVFEKSITTAVHKPGKVKDDPPQYDVMVEYEEDKDGGELPTHGMHLWLGQENEPSTFIYIGDDVTYETTIQVTNELRQLIQVAIKKEHL
ncbi:hypothetical protein [Metabacillus malikii]|uniref:YhfM-like domain-containing protein n=1 Tax=Metabacillus malikii TaxID=1504265 RepID=A0ABT9ZHD3_9BACI|nr:hypothetical protein [Metabacillus malikii]MDQ0231701.1 hypothetical protein [Metabacillus malikii]